MISATRMFRIVMVMVITLYIGIVGKRSSQKLFHCCICISGNTAVQLNSGICQCSLCTGSNPAANQGVHLLFGKDSSQSTMPVSVGAYHLSIHDFPLRNLVDLELLCMAEVAEHAAIFVSDRDLHSVPSFQRREKSAFVKSDDFIIRAPEWMSRIGADAQRVRRMVPPPSTVSSRYSTTAWPAVTARWGWSKVRSTCPFSAGEAVAHWSLWR